MLCCVDDVKRGKESPDVYNYTIKKLGLTAAECIIFEDVLPAIKSAKLTGAIVYGVYEKYSAANVNAIKDVANGFIQDFSLAPILKK